MDIERDPLRNIAFAKGLFIHSLEYISHFSHCSRE